MHHRVSPRSLGALLVEPFCPRDYYYQVQMGFKLPFDRPMPGIMYNLDNFQKAIVEAHLDSEAELPEWLQALDCTSSIAFPPKMTAEIPEYDLTMVGMPDAVFKKTNGDLCVIDYKTARYKGADDPFLPIYEIQLLGYAFLLESNEIGKVDSAGLVYFENQLKEHQLDPLNLLSKHGFDVPFAAKIREVQLDRSALKPLLKRYREFADMTNPPEGLEQCKNCALLEKLFSFEQNLRNQEDSLRRRNDYFLKVRLPKIEAWRRRAKHAWNLTEDDDQELIDLDFLDSVPASWDL